MNTKTKKIFLIVFTVIWVAGLYVLSRLIFVKHRDSYFPMEGILIGVFLIAVYQQKLLFAWAYKFRLLINSFLLGLGCLVIGLGDSIFLGYHSKFLMHLTLDFAAGFTFGLFFILMKWLLFGKRKRFSPYSGNEIPALESKSVRFNFDQSSTGGRAFLLSDKLVFASGASSQTVPFSEIISMETGRVLGFPNKLVFLLKEAESLSISVSMPFFWKKKITEAMKLNGMELG